MHQSTLICLLSTSAALWSSVAWGQEEAGTRLGVRVSAGLEYDDNVLRTTLADTAPRPDGLSRYFASVDLAHRQGQVGTLLQVRQGGKLFWSEHEADALLTQVTLQTRYRFDETWSVGGTLDAKDRTERRSILDYTRGGATLDVAGAWRHLELSVGGGWRTFIYKPNPSASSQGLAAQVAARVLFTDAWSLQLGYGLTQRAFTTRRFVSDEDADPDAIRLRQTEALRRDSFHSVNAALQWQGPLVIELAYQYSDNQSNSYGQGLKRHAADITLTAPLFWELFLSANLGLQRTLYDDAVLVDANFRVDEENRNQAVVALQLPFLDGWDAELRYSLFAQEFGAGGDYGRQTLMFALGYTYE
jgi:hypothetical protein